ncbi:type A2 lantipeptide [Streptomyces sp. NPDC005408]|uniref:type A2 lantipeptide n=1 Tax=Streptomyces sp. NPDC005408 TaxID=3155341 RepID=UPI0033B33C0E
MNSTPQVETQVISDADLDNVSGGLVGQASGAVLGTVDSVLPVSGLAAAASGTVGSVIGTAEGLTGLNTAGVTGLVAGL